MAAVTVLQCDFEMETKSFVFGSEPADSPIQ